MNTISPFLIVMGMTVFGIIRVSFCPAGETDALDLDDVINIVSSNEQLYMNLGVAMQAEYRALAAEGMSVPGKKRITRISSLTKYTTQNDKFRLEVERSRYSDEKFLSRTNRIRVFDGQETSLVDGNIVNYRPNRVLDSQAIIPHMFLLLVIEKNADLSAYLGNSGTSPANEPQTNEGVVEATYEGTGQFQDLTCHKVVITEYMTTDHRNFVRWELWMPEKHNLIPVRLLGFSSAASSNVPCLEGTVTEFREIAPGIWFPIAATITGFDKNAIREEGVKKPRWEWQLNVTDVSLSPDVGDGTFKRLEGPKGAAVYNLDSNGNINNSFRRGAPEAHDGLPIQRSLGYWWIAGANVAIFAAVGVLIVIKKVVTNRPNNR